MAIPDSTQRRLDKLVDRNMYRNEAQYHAQVRLMQRWLDMTQMAMRDEGIDVSTAERVLNRVVFGAPDPSNAYERIDMHEQMREMAEKTPINMESVNKLLRTPVTEQQSGLIHGPHMTNRPRTHPPGWYSPPEKGREV
jgi:hypothetical protein